MSLLYPGMKPMLEFLTVPSRAEAKKKRRRRKIRTPENPKVKSVSISSSSNQEESCLVLQKWVSPQFSVSSKTSLRDSVVNKHGQQSFKYPKRVLAHDYKLKLKGLTQSSSMTTNKVTDAGKRGTKPNYETSVKRKIEVRKRIESQDQDATIVSIESSMCFKVPTKSVDTDTCTVKPKHANGIVVYSKPHHHHAKPSESECLSPTLPLVMADGFGGSKRKASVIRVEEEEDDEDEQDFSDMMGNMSLEDGHKEEEARLIQDRGESSVPHREQQQQLSVIYGVLEKDRNAFEVSKFNPKSASTPLTSCAARSRLVELGQICDRIGNKLDEGKPTTFCAGSEQVCNTTNKTLDEDQTTVLCKCVTRSSELSSSDKVLPDHNLSHPKSCGEQTTPIPCQHQLHRPCSNDQGASSFCDKGAAMRCKLSFTGGLSPLKGLDSLVVVDSTILADDTPSCLWPSEVEPELSQISVLYRTEQGPCYTSGATRNWVAQVSETPLKSKILYC